MGKTSIIQRFLNDISSTPCGGTLQEMYSGALSLVSGDVPIVSFTIEDTGGQYSTDFPAMLPISVRQADVVVLVYSLAHPESFDEISLLRETVTAIRPDVPLLVVGNKSDLIREGFKVREIKKSVRILTMGGRWGLGVILLFLL